MAIGCKSDNNFKYLICEVIKPCLNSLFENYEFLLRSKFNLRDLHEKVSGV